MRIGIDVREACSERRTGKGQWAYHWTSALLSAGCDVTLFAGERIPLAWQRSVDGEPDRIRVHRSAAKGLFWHWRTAKYLQKDATIDAYVTPTSYIVPFLTGKTRKMIPVVHDLIAFRGEPHDRKAMMIERMTLQRAVMSAHMVCTVSDTTKRDLLLRYPALPPERVVPLYAGPTIACAEARDEAELLVVCIGTLCPRKNQERLIRAFTSLPSSARGNAKLLLIGGRGWRDEGIVRIARRYPYVEWRGYLPDAECSVLLGRATIFAYPSLYEGFGLPVLDAFRCGVPVLTSDGGSLKEIAGDAALTVDPQSVSSIAQGLGRLMTDASLRDSLVQKGRLRAQQFTWERSARLFLEALVGLTKDSYSTNVETC